MLDAVAGGVMFGVEPVSGRSDRDVVAASRRGADAVVSGDVNGSRHVHDIPRRHDPGELDEGVAATSAA